METTNGATVERVWDPELLRRLAARLAPLPTPLHGGHDPAIPEVRIFGSTAVSRNRTGLPPSAIRNFNCADLGLLDGILEWMADSGRSAEFLLTPWDATEAVRQALAERGFQLSPTRTSVLATATTACDSPAAPIEFAITPARPSDAKAVAKILVGSNPWKPYGVRLVRETLERTFPSGGTHYLAFAGDAPIGTASFSIRDSIAVLRGAAVLPDWRGQGVQRALIARRLRDAMAAGAAWVVAEAEAGSASQRNLRRAGLEVAWVAERWKPIAD